MQTTMGGGPTEQSEELPPGPSHPLGGADWSRWLFRWRSYTPLLPLAVILTLVAINPEPASGARGALPWPVLGLAMGLLGIVIRGWTAGSVPPGTSGRGTKDLKAESLNTDGVYSLVRHPLYLGNFLMWMGVAILSGRLLAIPVTALVFWIYHRRIVMLEEGFLHARFGDRFTEWAARTPAFVPNLSGWVPSGRPFSIPRCLGRDYAAFYGFVAATTAVALVRCEAGGGGWNPGPAWDAYFGLGTAAYLLLRMLKFRTRLLEHPEA